MCVLFRFFEPGTLTDLLILLRFIPCCTHTGFGSSLRSEDCIRSCCEYVDEQFRAYFAEESGVVRKNIVDNRVHCCLYFIPGHCHRYFTRSKTDIVIFRRPDVIVSFVLFYRKIRRAVFSLRPVDVEFMLSIHEKVNVIPVISKADMLTEKEKSRVKQRINESIKEHGIKV